MWPNTTKSHDERLALFGWCSRRAAIANPTCVKLARFRCLGRIGRSARDIYRLRRSRVPAAIFGQDGGADSGSTKAATAQDNQSDYGMFQGFLVEKNLV
jgi:hypothetical protein